MQNETMIRPVPVYSPNGKMIDCVEGNLRAAVRQQVAAIRAYLEEKAALECRPVYGCPLHNELDPDYYHYSERNAGRTWKRHRRNRWRKAAIVSMVGA